MNQQLPTVPRKSVRRLLEICPDRCQTAMARWSMSRRHIWYHDVMELRELVTKNRSYRRFDGNHEISPATLRELVDLARHTPSAKNRQPLKYITSSSAHTNARIFETLAWAGALKDWAGPEEHERPTAYIVLLVDKELSPDAARDIGITAQTILLGAVDRGLGGCMVGSITRPALRAALPIPETLEICLVIALGKPVERVVLEDAAPGASVTYYREPDGTHHVPKRTLEELLVGELTE